MELVLLQSELDVIKAVAGRIVPDDDISPGALGIGADQYLVRALKAEYADFVSVYRGVAAAVDGCAVDRFGRGFAKLNVSDQDLILEELWRGPVGSWLDSVRSHVIEGLFSDPKWGGNREGLGWRLLGYPGPRREWTAAAQVVSGPGLRTRPALEPGTALSRPSGLETSGRTLPETSRAGVSCCDSETGVSQQVPDVRRGR